MKWTDEEIEREVKKAGMDPHCCELEAISWAKRVRDETGRELMPYLCHLGRCESVIGDMACTCGLDSIRRHLEAKL